MNRIWLWLLVLLLVSGCSAGSTWQGNTDIKRQYDVPFKIYNSDGGQVTLDIDLQGTSDMDQDVKTGDASAKLETLFTAAWNAAQAMGAKDGMNFMEDIKNLIKQWSDNDQSQDIPVEPGGSGTDPDPIPPVDPDITDGGGDGWDGVGIPDLDNLKLDNWEIAERADCDGEMSYRNPSEAVGTVQKKCVFTKQGSEYGRSFIIQWASGAMLWVQDSSSMAWNTEDYRKYQPQEPDHQGGYIEGSPAEVYAGRKDTSGWAQILIWKKPEQPDVAGYEFCEEYQWKGKDPDPSHDRAWWS